MQCALAVLALLLCASVVRAGDIPDPPWLRQELETVRQKHGLPALAAAVVWRGEIIAASAVGIRRLGF